MLRTRCRMIAPAFVALALVAGKAQADELLGKVKSIDVGAKTVVISEKATDKESTITIGSGTSWYNEKKGKFSKKFDLAKLKVGSEVEVTREGGLASKVVIKPGKKKAKAS